MRIDHRRLLTWPALAAWCALITALVYGVALILPFFSDDVVHFPFVDTHTLPQLWQTAEGLLFYRPLAPTLRKLMQLALGYHDPVIQHALNLVLHLSNGLMVAWLAGHLWSSKTSDQKSNQWARRYLSASLFLLYPFSYQAIPWVGALFHPLVTALVLLSLISYLKMRKTQRRVWGAISLVLALISPFAHENGVLIGPIILLVELTQPQRSASILPALKRAVLWSLPALLWLPIWWSIPKGVTDDVALNGAEAVLQNSAYFFQGIAYPFSWMGGWLHDQQGVPEYAAAIGLSLAALIGAAVIQWRSGATRRDLLPYLWFALASAPSILFLRVPYVLGGPRLLMLGSVGAVWLWSDVLLRIAHWKPARATSRLAGIAAAALCLALLIQNYSFIHAHVELFQMGGSVMQQVVAATLSSNQVDSQAIFLNLPSTLAPSPSTYALGRESVQFFPHWAALETMVSINTAKAVRAQVASYEPIQPATPYAVVLRGAPPRWVDLAAQQGHVFIASYHPDQIVIQPLGRLNAALPAGQPIALFGESTLALLDASATLNQSELQINLTWQVRGPVPQNATVFVHVLDEHGQLIAQADGDALARSFPFWQWADGSIVQDTRLIDVRGSASSVGVGLYDWQTGERLTAKSSAGAPWADNVAPISIQRPGASVP